MTEINDRLTALLMESYDKGVSDAKAIAEASVNEVVARVLSEQRELIASWVADMCQGLDADTIAEAIRNGGNDAMDNFKVGK
jgi:hypothetical protein